MAKTRLSFFKLIVLFLCVCLVPIFAGCDLVSVNVDKQLNEVVASFDNGRVNVTREKLIITYNSIGNSRYDSSSTPTAEGVDKTVDLALDRAILVDFLTSETQADLRAELGVEKLVLSTYQANEVWRNVYSYINSSVKSYEDDLRKDDGLTVNEDSSESTDESAYTEYKHTYSYYFDNVSNKYVLEKIEDEKTVENNSIALFDTSANLSFSQKAKAAYDNFRSKYWEYTDSKVMNPDNKNETSYSDKAWTKYINSLLRSESSRNLSKDTNEVFLREVQRIYDIYYENQVLSAFQENFTDSLTVTKEAVATKFKALYNAQYEAFNKDSSAFSEMIPTKGEGVYYMQDPQAYFKVNHILIKFSDEQNEAIKAEETKYKNEMITYAEYQKNVAAIKSQIKAYNRDTKEYESITSVYTALNSALASASGVQEKMAIFRDFMHRYSQDDATLNADSCYYIPVKKYDSHGDSNDVMEQAFADASRELYSAGKVGGYSNWVETSYGYHIVMYTGNASAIDGTLNTDSLLSQLNAYYLNPLYSKTMLDSVIDTVSLSSYSTYESSLLGIIKAEKNIVKYTSNYSDLYS